MMTLKPTLNTFIWELLLRLAVLSVIPIYHNHSRNTSRRAQFRMTNNLFLLSFSEKSLLSLGKKKKNYSKITDSNNYLRLTALINCQQTWVTAASDEIIWQ